MSLLSDVVAALDAEACRYALIGAAAMAVHGVSRATADVDLFTVDVNALRKQRWTPFEERGIRLRLLKGDFEDALAGSVRLVDGADVVDVVVGRNAWEREQIDAAVVRSVGELAVPVMEPPGLVLLKLHAGGPKDAWDIQALLEVIEDPSRLVAEVERTLPRLPADARSLWSRIREHHRPR